MNFRGELAGVYTITGGRQVEKTTLLKQWMCHLIQSGAAPSCIAYLTGELIDDHHSLIQILSTTLNEMPIGQNTLHHYR